MEGSIAEEVKAQESRLGLPVGFYDRLIEEDDWSFVIKLNALVEAACTDALVARFHNPELAHPLATLDLGHVKHGKIALLSALNALAPDQISLLRLLLELRNKVAHNVSQVTFSFEKHIHDMDTNQRKAFMDRVGHGIKDEIEGMTRQEFVLKHPKYALWATTQEILACLHLEHDVAETQRLKFALEVIEKARGAP